jgi:hypothetical protein
VAMYRRGRALRVALLYTTYLLENLNPEMYPDKITKIQL